MNEIHLHLMVNHLPIIVPAVGIFILIAGLFLRSNILIRTAFCIFIFTGIAAFMAGWSGEGAEHTAEKITGISHDLIHEHEEAAEPFVLVCYLLMLLAIIGLWANLKNKSFAKIMTWLVFITASLGIYLSFNVGTTGGEIRHEEIRSANHNQPSSEQSTDDDQD